jgi:hypothetical protein
VDEYKECERIEQICYKLLDQFTKRKAGYWKAKCGNRNLYLDTTAALKENIIDKVVMSKSKKRRTTKKKRS